MIDTHLHLGELDDPSSAAREAAAAGVAVLITMGMDAGSNRAALSMAREHPGVVAGVGHHPTVDTEPDLAYIRRAASDSMVVAVGEIGLDGGPSAPALDVQSGRLDALLDLALDLDLPVSLHCREAAALLYDVLSRHTGLRGVMHYFSLDRRWAGRFLDLGLHLSFAGLITRTSQSELREVVRACPADRLLLETDAPFGVPRGRRPPNRPAWIWDTARVVAEVRGQTLAEVAALETANARALFRLAA